MGDSVIVEADGGSRGNPGPAGYGAAVTDRVTGAVLAERNEFLGVQTNNVAEYQGLIAGLSAARELGARRVLVRMDSKLVIEQMGGAWQVKHPGLQPLHAAARAIADGFDEISYEWIPRAQNTHADRLANEAMDRGGASAAPTARSWAPPSLNSTRLHLVRHGSTVHSTARRFSGHNNLELDAPGQAQAAALAERAVRFGDVAAVISSPIVRTRQTAAAIAEALGVPVVINDDFAEVNFGDWEGLTFDELTASYPEAARAWYGSPDVSPPGGESMAALAARVSRGVAAVRIEFGEQRVVVVTHVSPIKAIVREVLGAPPESIFRMHLDTASVSIVDFFGDGAASLRLFNDISHLAHLQG